MRILISNDDGIHAAGIQALTRVLANVAEVTVVAPDRQRSASSHGISLYRPIRVEEGVVEGATAAYQTSGTPVDCVKWALALIHREKPFDFVLSGINAGANLATDVLYSGTIAAAGEAALQGVPAIAFSAVGPPFDFDEASSVANSMFNVLKSLTFPSDTFISVNIPPNADGTKYRFTTLGVRKYHDVFTLELDSTGQQVYRYGGDLIDERGDGSLDVDVVEAGFVSVTPLRYSFTDWDFVKMMNKNT